jgi:signal transduction histidine kinase
VDVRQLIRSCVDVERPRAESLGLTITTGVPVRIAAVSGDFEALRRVIRGLIDNAIKYTPAGGVITVSASEIDEGVAISVSDTGKGIPAADLPHVFEKFYRVPSETASGVGLGLYLAQHIVSQLDGELTVESEPGRGTIFTVLLPRWTVSAQTEEETHVKALVGS